MITKNKVKCVCKICNIDFMSRATNVKYCEDCRPIARREVKLRHYYKFKNEPNHMDKARQRSKIASPIRYSKAIERGKEISAKVLNTGCIWQEKMVLPCFNQSITFCVPFDMALSKNRMSNWGNGRYYKNPNTISAQEVITLELNRSKMKWIQTKLYFDLLVEKPNQRTDAINFVDTIADAIKVATGIDDRWYCIGRVDWIINKNDPKIWITVRQDTSQEHQICSHCGRILPLWEFVKSKQGKIGVGRECKECKSAGRKRNSVIIT